MKYLTMKYFYCHSRITLSTLVVSRNSANGSKNIKHSSFFCIFAKKFEDVRRRQFFG